MTLPKKRSPKERGLVGEVRTLRERLREKDAIIHQQTLAVDGHTDYIEQQRREAADLREENERLKATLREQGHFVKLHAEIAELALCEVTALQRLCEYREKRATAEKELTTMREASRARAHTNPLRVDLGMSTEQLEKLMNSTDLTPPENRRAQQSPVRTHRRR